MCLRGSCHVWAGPLLALRASCSCSFLGPTPSPPTPQDPGWRGPKLTGPRAGDPRRPGSPRLGTGRGTRPPPGARRWTRGARQRGPAAARKAFDSRCRLLHERRSRSFFTLSTSVPGTCGPLRLRDGPRACAPPQPRRPARRPVLSKPSTLAQAHFSPNGPAPRVPETNEFVM